MLRYLGVAHSEEQKKALIQIGKAEIRKIKSLPEPKIKKDDRCDGVLLGSVSEVGRVIDGLHEIFGVMFDKIGLRALFTPTQYERLKDVVISRIAEAKSKLQTAELMSEDYGKHLSVNQIYRLMDLLPPLQNEIQKRIFETSKCFMQDGKVDVLLYDVTTLHFESQVADSLRNFGMSKAHKIGEVQVVLALATDVNGLPVGYHLFPGNTAEVSTLLISLNEWIPLLQVREINVVADRAMMSETNLSAMEVSELKYIVAAKLKTLPKNLQEDILSRKSETSTHVSNQSMMVQEFTYRGRRLVVSYSNNRAKKDKKDRERLLALAEKRYGGKVASKKLITNRGYLKYYKEEVKGSMVFQQAVAEEEARWDGLHGVITNDLQAPAKSLLERYRSLWRIEESFRVNKHTLEMRPIFHFTPRRIEAHILICYMSYAISRYVQLQITRFHREMSIDKIKNALKRVSSSILASDEGEMFRLPCKVSEDVKMIYRSFGIRRINRPEKLAANRKKCSGYKKN
jgi:transposase